MRRRQRQQARQRLQRTDARQFGDIPLHQRVDVVPVPVRPPTAGRPRQRWWIAPGDDARGQRHAKARTAARGESLSEQRIQKSRRLALQFRLRQRVQPHHFHASRQRIRKFWHREHMRRSSEQKAPRRAALVHRALQRQEQRRYPLHLVQHHALWQVRHKAFGIRASRLPHYIVVEAHIGVAQARADRVRQRGLAALARAVDQHHWRVRQRLQQARLRVARIQIGRIDFGWHRLIAALGCG